MRSDWTPTHVYEPVQLSGTLTIDPSEHAMNVVDGLMPMRATFRMDADVVETLDNSSDQLRWAQSVQDRLRAATGRKTAGPRPQDQ